MRWYRFGTDYFVCDCEKRKMYWVYIQFFCKKQAGKTCHLLYKVFIMSINEHIFQFAQNKTPFAYAKKIKTLF